ncbi:30S ribosomal protein S20 [Patescibacteria group bacterium]|nr:30S ribosomal protein S20 [Patescibacteria group bacterium]
MPNLKNAKKALRQSERRAERNMQAKGTLDFMRRSFRKLLDDKKVDEAAKLLKDMNQALDKAVAKGVLKRNTASRLKSRATLRINKVSAK